MAKNSDYEKRELSKQKKVIEQLRADNRELTKKNQLLMEEVSRLKKELKTYEKIDKKEITIVKMKEKKKKETPKPVDKRRQVLDKMKELKKTLNNEEANENF